MTNMPSGSKRPHPESEHPKRPRERDEPRDWRDIHLNGVSRPTETSNSRRDETYGQKARKDHKPDRRDSRPGSARDRDSRRDADTRDSRRANRDGNRRPYDSSARPPSHVSKTIENVMNAEKEEGEISGHDTPELGHKTTTPTPEPEPELELELHTPPPVEDSLAARRARRQAILAKYAEKSATPEASGMSSAVPPLTPSISVADPQSQQPSVPASPITKAPGAEQKGVKGESATPDPEIFDLAKEEEAGQAQTVVQHQNEEDGAAEQSAADYDPSMDRREDEHKRLRNDQDVHMVAEDAEEEYEEVEEVEEDLDDMFAIDDEKPKKVKKKVKKSQAPAIITTAVLDSAADAEGYYSVILGEQLDGGRYQVFSVLGKGMFAIVVRARILQGAPEEIGQEVAIKITRSQESMVKAGHKEVQVLNKLKQADPEDKRHIVRLERTFEHRGHLCLVFESLSMNLREIVKRFGKDVGLNIRAVRAYAHQLFLALGLLKKCNIMHADIKPDNILVNEAKTLIKLCDLGSASDASENDITPYLVSRFYRAPEIILGIPYDPSLDMWSIGCTLYELYTGKILFPGRSNNHMLLLMMELRGRFTSKLIKRAEFGSMYFDESGAFNSIEHNRLTGTDSIRPVHISNPKRDLRTRLIPPASAKLKDDELKMISSFVDLLDKCLMLDPAKRLTPRDALMHPFIRG